MINSVRKKIHRSYESSVLTGCRSFSRRLAEVCSAPVNLETQELEILLYINKDMEILFKAWGFACAYKRNWI